MLDENQWGCIPNCSADIVALVDEFIMETHQLTYRNLLKIHNDTKAYFDRIVNSRHAILNSWKFEAPNKICQFHSTTLRNTKHRVQTDLDTTQFHYPYTPNKHIHGAEQG